jgi:hypothetical protein
VEDVNIVYIMYIVLSKYLNARYISIFKQELMLRKKMETPNNSLVIDIALRVGVFYKVPMSSYNRQPREIIPAPSLFFPL